MPDDSSVTPGRRVVLALGCVILGLHPAVFALYSWRSGVPAPRGLYLGPQNLVLWILSFVMYGLLFAALYVRQRGARSILVVFLTLAAASGTPDLLTAWRQGRLGALFAGGMGMATFVAVAATLIRSRSVRAYLATKPTARWLGVLLLAGVFGILALLLVLGSLPTASPSRVRATFYSSASFAPAETRRPNKLLEADGR